MTARNGEGVYGDGTGVVTPLAHKLSQNGPLVKDATGTPRSGVFYAGTATLVTGKASMAYDVAPFEAAICRARTKGTSFPTNDGVVTVATTAAPGANSRIDIIYVQQAEASEGDPDTEAVIDVAQGTASSSPTAPAIPDGAIELARAVVGAGITGTQDAVITQTAAFTAPLGSAVPFRSKAAMDAWTSAVPGQMAIDLSAPELEYRWSGSVWARPQGEVLLQTKSGSSVSALSLDAIPDAGDYDFFRFVVNVTARSAAAKLGMRLRVGGVDASTALYDEYFTSAATATQWQNLATAVAGPCTIEGALYDMSKAAPTRLIARSTGAALSDGTGINMSQVGGQHRPTTAYDAFTIIAASGTFTGTITVFGVRA